MKKIVINILDSTYEKFRFEAIFEQKSIQDIIQDRIFYKNFSEEVEHAFEIWMETAVTKILED